MDHKKSVSCITYGFLALSLLVAITSCRNQQDPKATVSGFFPDSPGIRLVLQEMDVRETHTLDSVTVDPGGRFGFRPVVREPGFYMLQSRTGTILVLLLNMGDNIELTGSLRDFPDNVIVKGPPETMLLHDFFRRTRVNEKKADSLEMKLEERQDSSDYYRYTQTLDPFFKQIWENQRSLEIKFIEDHPGSLASLVVLNYAFGMSPVLSPEEDFSYYSRLDSSLYAAFPKNKHVKFHHERMTEIIQRASAQGSPRQTPHR
jgi:hypothetical protein